MKHRLARFMAGRSGPDQLSRFLLAASLVWVLLSALFKNTILGTAFWALGLGTLIWCYIRMFSRNVAKRRAENERYLSRTAGLRREFAASRTRAGMRKDYRFFKCPSCKTMLRVPRGKGRILIRCTKCGQSFEKKT